MRKNIPMIAGIVLAVASLFICCGSANAGSIVGVNPDSPFFGLLQWVGNFYGPYGRGIIDAHYAIAYAVIIALSVGVWLIVIGRFPRANRLVVLVLCLLAGTTLANLTPYFDPGIPYHTNYQEVVGYLGPPVARFVVVYPLLTISILLASVVIGGAGGLLAWRRSPQGDGSIMWLLLPVVAVSAIMFIALWIFPYPLGFSIRASGYVPHLVLLVIQRF